MALEKQISSITYYALPGNAENIYGFLLLTDRHGRVRLLNRCSQKIKYDFELEEIENYKDFASIYNNPIYDIQDHYGSAGTDEANIF